MSTQIQTASDIPAAPYYVTALDTFMSGWGEASGRRNYVCLPCESREEAEVVAANAKARTDMERVHIDTQKPEPTADVVLSLMTRDEAGRWYEPGGFARD